MGIRPGKTACLRCVFPQPPDPSNLPTCDTSGVLGPAAAAVAALQAATAMRFIVDPAHAAGLLSVDVWEGQMRSLNSASNPDPDCPCCSKRQFPFLSTAGESYTTTLCGRKAVQIQRAGGGMRLDLPQAAERLKSAGTVRRLRLVCSMPTARCRRYRSNALSRWTPSRPRHNRPHRARSLYARYVGT